MNDKGFLIEIQYSLLSREKETYLAPVESATRYTTWTKKQRKTLNLIRGIKNEGVGERRES